MGKMILSKMFQLIQDYTQKYLPNERKLSSNTIRSYRFALVSLLDFTKQQLGVPLYKLSFEKISKDIVLQYLQFVEDGGCSANTRNQRLYAIQLFYKYAAREELDAVIYWDQIRKITPAKVKQSTIGFLSEEAVQTVLEQPDVTNNKGLRDYYIMLMLYKTGCRVEELVNIRLSDVHLSKSPYITLHGKGNKDRNVPLLESLTIHTKNYIKTFHSNNIHIGSDYLIFSVRDGVKRRMTEDNVRKIVRKYGKLANKICSDVPQNLHPHLFRHTFAMHAYQHGIPLEILKDWLGHADYTATRIYAKADTEMKRKAIEKAFPEDSPLRDFVDSEIYKIDDDDVIKKLCGLA